MMRIRLSLKTKMALVAFALGCLTSFVSFIGIQVLSNTHRHYNATVQSQIPTLSALTELRKRSDELHVATLIYQTDVMLDTSPATIVADREKILDCLQKLQDGETDYLDAAKEEATFNDGQLAGSSQTIITGRQQVAGQTLAFVQLKDADGSVMELANKLQTASQSQTDLTRSINEILHQQEAVISNSSLAADRQTTRVEHLTYAFMSITLIAVLGAGFLTASIVANRIKRLEAGTIHIAAGDFSYKVAINSNDELGQLANSFNQMSNRFQDSYRRLAFAKQRDEALIESMSEGLIALDEDGKIVLLNKVAADLFGLPTSDAANGRPLLQIAKLYDQKKHLIPRTEHPAYTTLKTGESSNGVYIYKIAGAYRLLNISASPVTLDGKVAGTIVIMRDVTKEKEVDRMKTEFISLASHQLRTPLSAIKWFSEMLLNGDAGKLKNEQIDFTQSISDSTERMIELVNALLNISRMESGRIIVDPKPTDLGQLVSGIIDDLKAKTAEKQQTLLVSVHEDLQKINLDPHLISQVYMNFLTNSIKYTPIGGQISVVISKKGKEVVSQISDNGFGIPKEQQKRVFDKFFRAENIAKVETDGTGLGLYLVKAIVESSGGRVWFESEEGKGTTFWFTIPLSGMKKKEGEVTLDDQVA